MKSRGFTIIELLVVIAIIGLLSTVAVVATGTTRDKAKIAAGQSFDQSLRHALGDQLVGEWLMNECSGNTVTDSSNNGNTATFGGTAGWSTLTPTGTGCSASFSGSNYLRTSFNLQSPDVTFTAWIYPTDVSGNNGIIAKERQWQFHISDGILHALTGCNGADWSGGSDLTGSQIPVNTWSMVSLAVDSVNRTAKIFLNGHAVAQSGGCGTPSGYNNNFISIGSHSANTVYHPFQGNIDDARVYTSALSLSQIEKLYAVGLPSHILATQPE